MKKEYLILIAIILVLSAYLVFHKENQDNYTLPEITKIDRSKITALTVEKKGRKIEFKKQGDNWELTDKKYLAKQSNMNSMLDVFEKLKLSALVSEKGDLKRYELDEEMTIKAVAKDNDAILLEINIGKTAPTFNHTFIMLKNDKNVYHANDSFRTYFDKTVDEFRDKKVLEFKEEAITGLMLEKEGLSKTLVAKDTKTDKGKTNKQWAFADGSAVQEEALSDLISSLALLECNAYVPDVTKQSFESKAPVLKITVSDKTPLVLTLFGKEGEKILEGISTQNNDVFKLGEYTGNDIVSNVDKILGIKKEENAQDGAPKE